MPSATSTGIKTGARFPDAKAAIAISIERPRNGPTVSIASTPFCDTIVAQIVSRQHDMLNCLGIDAIGGKDCIKKRSVRGRCWEQSDALLDKSRRLSDCGACRRGEDGNVVV